MKFKLGGGVPLGYAYAPIAENKKRVRKVSTRFLAFSNEVSTVKKMVMSSSQGQGNFRRLEASRPRIWPSRPRPRTSKCVLEDVLEDVLEAKDVFEDSTSPNTHRRLRDCDLLGPNCKILFESLMWKVGLDWIWILNLLTSYWWIWIRVRLLQSQWIWIWI